MNALKNKRHDAHGLAPHCIVRYRLVTLREPSLAPSLGDYGWCLGVRRGAGEVGGAAAIGDVVTDPPFAPGAGEGAAVEGDFFSATSVLCFQTRLSCLRYFQ